ncbi:M48 family metallopeptidase [Horticoccus luteus]|uniref:M48 family metallopeptidase n=1 Tax=Horticoccus luteus TaxID=2862869 RepID=A0A8F9TYK5_9BACT|nr:M48 family metallopeptidase [Horticoccus luteus]QYM80593.1 M48 family metallopeptidase [Horticoccus luteus]
MKRFLPLLAAALFALAGCYTNPVTGRQSLVLVQPSQELALGAQSFQAIRQQEKVSTDAKMNERVKRVGERIAAAVGSEMPNAQWEFVVFDSPEVNAFALPGGKVGVYSGLLKLATTDDELAIVMGHEIGHVVARHGAERMSEQMVIDGLGALGDAYAQNHYSPQTVQLFETAYGGATTVGRVLPHSRANESEADHMGVVFAAQAGYDPRAAITFWKKMSELKTTKPGLLDKFLSTHPADAQRIADLQALMPQVVPIYEAKRKNT